MQCHLKCDATQNECHSKWNVTQKGISPKIECHSTWNATQKLMSLKIKCPSKYIVTKMEFHSK